MNPLLTPTIRVLFSCDMCCLVDVPVTMRARSDGEDLMKWMDELGQVMSDEHRRRSPRCRPRKLDRVKIPYVENQPVGTPPRS